ncbi:MAG: hypothetical protein IPO85_17020 [Saprospiraceae bacterium]|uniref:Uncharacterized protein n=1 Tax=Candidatus Defluviibacterium haderslevense TaxID=2981993 RepID=A0A9D7SCB4_9BACT|nr:hypothetical protein [Candidatus Defluviibacterium haderslevense]
MEIQAIWPLFWISGADLGNGLKLVTSNACDGSGESFLLIWGTVNGTGLPTLNHGTEPFYAQFWWFRICFLLDLKSLLVEDT